jgi:hypothetical protein
MAALTVSVARRPDQMGLVLVTVRHRVSRHKLWLYGAPVRGLRTWKCVLASRE